MYNLLQAYICVKLNTYVTSLFDLYITSTGRSSVAAVLLHIDSNPLTHLSGEESFNGLLRFTVILGGDHVLKFVSSSIFLKLFIFRRT